MYHERNSPSLETRYRPKKLVHPKTVATCPVVALRPAGPYEMTGLPLGRVARSARPRCRRGHHQHLLFTPVFWGIYLLSAATLSRVATASLWPASWRKEWKVERGELGVGVVVVVNVAEVRAGAPAPGSSEPQSSAVDFFASGFATRYSSLQVLSPLSSPLTLEAYPRL